MGFLIGDCTALSVAVEHDSITPYETPPLTRFAFAAAACSPPGDPSMAAMMLLNSLLRGIKVQIELALSLTETDKPWELRAAETPGVALARTGTLRSHRYAPPGEV
jgi:hypothetical protein